MRGREARNLDAGPVGTVHSCEMRCGSCRWDNPAGIIFCTNCGKRITDRAPMPGAASDDPPGTGAVASTDSRDVRAGGGPECPGCGAGADRGMQFCRECGGPLAAAKSQAGAGDGSRGAAGAVPPVCARCDAPRDTSARFCRACGASHDGDATSSEVQRGAVNDGHVRPRLVTLLKDGSEGRSIPLMDQDADIGAREGSITFPDDPYLSPRHARVACRSGDYTLRDLDSVNGVYVRLRGPVDVHDRDVVLIGQQVLRFELLSDGERPLGPASQNGVLVFGTPEVARFARLVQYTTEGLGRDVHYLFRDETVVGRENGDIVFTDDPFLSRRHAALRVDRAAGRFTLHDLGSSNGTAIRIRGEHVLKDGDQFRIGRHLFRFEAGLQSSLAAGSNRR